MSAQPTSTTSEVGLLNSGLTQLHLDHTDVNFTDKIIPLLLKCPNEIIIAILSQIHPKYLFSLRLANRALHLLVHKHEYSLCQDFTSVFTNWNGGPQSTGICPHNDLPDMYELTRRMKTAGDLARMLADRVVSKLAFLHAWGTDDEIKAWRHKKSKRLELRLTPALFILYGFLAAFREVFVHTTAQLFSTLSDEEYLSMRDVFALDQQRIIEQLNATERFKLVDITCAFRIFQGVLEARHIPMNECAQRHPFTPVRTVLVCCGLAPFADLLADKSSGPTSIKARKSQLDQLNDRIWHTCRAEQLQQLENVSHSDLRLRKSGPPSLPRDVPPIVPMRRDAMARPATLDSLRRNPRHVIEFIDRQDLWDGPAFAVMQRSDLKRSPHIAWPVLETWIKEILIEKEDPAWHLGRWARRD